MVGAGPSLRGKVDLRAFYSAGVIIRSGHGSQLYDYDYQEQVQNASVSFRAGALPFLYPSFAALPFVPLTLVSYRVAFLMFLGINIGLLLLAAFIVRPELPVISNYGWFALPALYGCLFGVSVALMQGQISFLLLVVYCGAWKLLRDGRPFLAGLLLSVALAKFQIAIPIVFLFIVWKQWRFVSGFLAGAVALMSISVGIVGRTGVSAYVHAMTGLTKQTALNAAAARVRYGMFPVDMPNLHGLTFGLTRGAHWGLILNVVLSCAVLGFAARQRASLLVALPAAMLVSYHMQPHDLTLLLLPLSFLVDQILVHARQHRDGGRLRFDVRQSVLLYSLPLLVLPLAAVVMAYSMNYVVALAVCAVMVSATKAEILAIGVAPASLE